MSSICCTAERAKYALYAYQRRRVAAYSFAEIAFNALVNEFLNDAALIDFHGLTVDFKDGSRLTFVISELAAHGFAAVSDENRA